MLSMRLQVAFSCAKCGHLKPALWQCGVLPGAPWPAALRQVHAAEPGLVVMPNGATNWGPTEVLLTAQVRGRAASRAEAPCMDML